MRSSGKPQPARSGETLSIVMVAACPFPARRGTPIRIQRLSEGLAARGHRVRVVAYHLGNGEELDPALRITRAPAVRSYRMLGPGPTYTKLAVLDPLLVMKLARVLRNEPVDVIHAHHYEGCLVAAAARLGTRVPLIFDVHTLLGSELQHYDLPLLPFRMKRAVARALDRRLPHRADHVVTVTDRIREKLIGMRAVSEERVSLVPNGVETGLFDLPRRQPEPDRHPTLIFTGNLAGYQRVDLLLAAFRRVLERRRDARLEIVTDSSFDPYAPMARELGVGDSLDVIHAGFPEIPGLLARADVALNPRTDCDGIPVKLLNYMAASKAVVSFAGSAPGLRHRETGWLAPDGNVEALADGTLALIEDRPLARELGRNARRFVELRHSWARSAELSEEVYRRVCA